MTTGSEGVRPVLRVVRGAPTDDEVAALVVAVSALSAPGDTVAPTRPRSRWAERSALVRRPLQHGPGAWRASAR
ncbi:MAG TPA: acyl-CoA carboxylase subunit epsilon [Actinophytocola sp.]|nr:acyl-CoA carboxylase subunit epsilon [Actinophytocola sp.]